jgi:phage protein D
VSVVNLNKARKEKVRETEHALAKVNAAKFGRNKAEKTLSQAKAEKAKRDLDGHAKE